ncbi:alginate lyase [Lachnospiraceae bacterium oral taxon 500]|nr:alginate lyase [Lachnospiraceae bacterium oral taxon 500]
MFQFTELQQAELRQRQMRFPQAMAESRAAAEAFCRQELLIPASGIANWTLYYYCPDCSVQLHFDRNRPQAHTCPSCGKVYRGEPYDSAWWGLVNDENRRAAYHLAITWLLTAEPHYAERAKQILLGYAENYADYQVHGDIPYNGPGRVGAQTLDEANFQRTMAMAYDIVQTVMTEAERDCVREQLLLPAADFLRQHRTPQLHNHEVIIDSAMAVIGILFQKEEYILPALYGKYGLYDQLEKGVLANGMWFEGAFSYHFYALASFFEYEKFALNTKYSGITHPNYRKMIEMPAPYWQAGQGFPLLNDANFGHEKQWQALYEFAYAKLGGEAAAFLLQTCYQQKERDNLEALLYGAEVLPPVKKEWGNFHLPAGSSGHTVLRAKDGRYLLFKHDCYGGEHDHYDRLGISYWAFGRQVSADLGTTGYGAKLHYDYYKNTGSHNTVMIGEQNQAPVNAVLTRYEEKDGAVYAEAAADWEKPYQMPDSFTIRQWSEEDYQNVKMKRQLIWMEDYFIEVFWVWDIPAGKSADWIMHFNGERMNAAEGVPAEKGYFRARPFQHLKRIELTQPQAGTYVREYCGGGIKSRVFGLANGQQVFDAYGPDNPSVKEAAYLIERRFGSRMLAAHVIESWREKAKIKEVSFHNENDLLKVEVVMGESKRCFEFGLAEGSGGLTAGKPDFIV